jgi:hypothetical protein
MEETQPLMSGINFNENWSDSVKIEYFKYSASAANAAANAVANAAANAATVIKLKNEGFSEEFIISFIKNKVFFFNYLHNYINFMINFYCKSEPKSLDFFTSTMLTGLVVPIISQNF